MFFWSEALDWDILHIYCVDRQVECCDAAGKKKQMLANAQCQMVLH